MQPSVQPPTITKISSSASLFETTQPADEHKLSITTYHDITQNFASVRRLKQGRTHFKSSEKAEVNLKWNRTVSSGWFLPVRHRLGHFQNKEGTIVMGGYFCLSSSNFTSFIWAEHVASYRNIKKSQRNNRRQRLPQMLENISCVCTRLQAGGIRCSSLEPVRGFKHIYICVCTNIPDCRVHGVGM